MIYDGLLILALLFMAGFVNLFIHLQIMGNEQLRAITEQGYNPGGPVFHCSLLVMVYGFFGFFWTRSGQTLGMQAWRIKVVTLDNQLITPRQSVVRFAVAIPALALGGVGLLWAVFDGQKRSWQDLASSSRVVLLNKPAGSSRPAQ